MERRYVDAIVTEIGLRMARFRDPVPTIDTLFFGGGTPTVLSEESWSKIFGELRKFFRFSSDIEITSEANPESATYEKLSAIQTLGVNRISFGAQSFTARNLERLGRLHNAEQVRIAVDNARRARFANISIDLMYGLPDETDETFHSDLGHAVSLNPNHISFYSLMLEGSVPLRYQVQRGEVLLPEDDQVAARYVRAVDFLARNGYHQYEISNFAQDGFQCRHNMSYWTMQDYFAFGPAAVGTIDGIRTKNNPDFYGYIKNLLSGKLPPHDREEINDKKLLLETIMLSLRLTSGLDVANLFTRHGYDIKHERRKLLLDLESHGDITIQNGSIHLTTQGMFRSDLIAASLCPDFV
jgi:oxygen-independent coproporphyrinogen-3 oxidase